MIHAGTPGRTCSARLWPRRVFPPGEQMYRRAVLEGLEKRQLLSASGPDAAGELVDEICAARPATVAGLSASAGVAAPSSAALEPAAPAAAAASTNPFAAELIGTFEGEVKLKKLFFRREFDVELTLTEVTDAGMTGKLTVDGHDAEGTFRGRLTPKGRFSYSLREDGRRVSINGKVVPQNDRLVGKLKAKGFGVSASGSFKLDRVPAPAPTQG